jgi:hypothetical protein
MIMKYNFFKSLLAIGLVVGMGFAINACKKNDGIKVAPQAVLFASAGTAGSYQIANDPNSVYKIPVGITAPSNSDVTIDFSITSPSGAAEGTQYTIAKKSVTIKAGTTVDSIPIKGLFSGYSSTRRDTLVFKITSTSLPTVSGSNSFTLIMQQFCPLVMSDFAGDFTVLVDQWEDYLPGDVIPVTVSGNTISFYFATAPDATQKPIVIKVDPNTFATSVDQVAYGHYGSPTIYSAKSVTSAGNVVVPCDKKITVTLNHTSAAGSYGNFIISLQKK